MTTTTIQSRAGLRPTGSPRLKDAAAASLTTLILLGVQAISHFPTLNGSGGDNDSLLRLVEVRDLIAGQGWFDLAQYRMGIDGGFIMHWSRLVDAPIAAIIVIGKAVSGSQAVGEMAAQLAWPLGLFGLALFLLLRLTRTIADEEALLPATVIGGAGLYYTGIFLPGALDHHNVQLVLTLAVMLALTSVARGARPGALAALLSVVMLAVGMETAPFVAAAGGFVAARFILGAAGSRGAAIGFGAVFLAASTAAFVMTVPANDWSSARCDSFSTVHLVLGCVAGSGLVLLATTLRSRRSARLVAILSLGMATALSAAFLFPQCIADPYAALDPDLKRFWLNAVSEAQPAWRVIASDPSLASGYYVTPAIGLAVLAWLRCRNETAWWVAAIFLAVAVVISVWQVRGARFSVPLATLPLAAWVGQLRRSMPEQGDARSSLKLAGAWLASLSLAWAALAAGLSNGLAPDGEAGETARASRCEAAADYSQLATLPPTTVLANSNLGAPILAYTHHRALSGPYHRNVDGNLAAIRTMMAGTEAEALVRASHVGLIAVCRGNDETDALIGWAPAGLLARLVRNERPDWLEQLPDTTGRPLEIYRVRGPA